jgi:hypothetical protein
MRYMHSGVSIQTGGKDKVRQASVYMYASTCTVVGGVNRHARSTAWPLLPDEYDLHVMLGYLD